MKLLTYILHALEVFSAFPPGCQRPCGGCRQLGLKSQFY